MFSGADCLARALALQQARCMLFNLWSTKFHQALTGAVNVADFQTFINDKIIAGFQNISLSLRQLQDSVRLAESEEETKVQDTEENDDDNKDERDETETMGDAAGSDGNVRRFLALWIEEVQRLEREHYRVSVELSQKIADHCTALPLTRRSEAGVVGKSTASALLPSSSLGADETSNSNCGNNDKSYNDNDDTDADGKEKNQITPCESRQCAPSANLHDAEQCALRRLIPLSSQTALTYVSCLDATWLSSAEEKTEDDEWVNMVLFGGESFSYLPREVKKRCAVFNSDTLPLWTAKRMLMEQLQELTEELQAELATARIIGKVEA